jgi:hypothetical protein
MTTAHYASWCITLPLHSRAIDLQGGEILGNGSNALHLFHERVETRLK